MAFDADLLAIMPDATVKKLTAPDGFEIDPFDKACRVSQGRIFIQIKEREFFMLIPDLDRLTFSVHELEKYDALHDNLVIFGLATDEENVMVIGGVYYSNQPTAETHRYSVSGNT